MKNEEGLIHTSVSSDGAQRYQQGCGWRRDLQIIANELSNSAICGIIPPQSSHQGDAKQADDHGKRGPQSSISVPHSKIRNDGHRNDLRKAGGHGEQERRFGVESIAGNHQGTMAV